MISRRRVLNPVNFGILKLPVDATIGNSDMVPIWNMKARQGMSLHWDGLSASLREVVLSSALATARVSPVAYNSFADGYAYDFSGFR